MLETITVTLPADLEPAFNDAIKEEGISPNEFVSVAVKEYLFLRRFRLLRERMVMQAQAQGIYTDQDVFKRVS
ncbi:hypothetical protein EDS67_04365 [candidate division KSB1 bacterium]|nr:MAG: hypothetical protein EDS67_04365 [candidate division KSB1 bacterium]MBC6952353.1 hypothetical protein [candidate division KSB1 bacterium]MCE7940661.1 hypothetical protein [Chlorobi bacterium CHB1]MDL1873886.1 hypothetical protein [Cytophagia bacterium CHB2]RIK72678.1 MAG: hypothetical protein DCC62_19060 [candidate division KSB1 bacterium]